MSPAVLHQWSVDGRSWSRSLPWSWSFADGHRCVAAKQYGSDKW